MGDLRESEATPQKKLEADVSKILWYLSREKFLFQNCVLGCCEASAVVCMHARTMLRGMGNMNDPKTASLLGVWPKLECFGELHSMYGAFQSAVSVIHRNVQIVSN